MYLCKYYLVLTHISSRKYGLISDYDLGIQESEKSYTCKKLLPTC